MTDVNLNVSNVLQPVLTQLVRLDALIFAYANATLDKEKFEKFAAEIPRQTKLSWKLFWEAYPEVISDPDGTLRKWLDSVDDSSETTKPQ